MERRLLIIGFVGYEATAGEKLMAGGTLPNIHRLRFDFFLRHAPHGMNRQSFVRVAARRLVLLTSAPAAVDYRTRARCLTTASWSAGRIRGSIRHGTLFL